MKALGVKWVETIRSYSVGTMLSTLRRAMVGPDKGLKVVIAEGECQLARQRRIRPLLIVLSTHFFQRSTGRRS